MGKHTELKASVSVGEVQSLSELFRRSRLAMGFDVEQLALVAAVSTEVIATIESRPATVSMSDLYSVANSLNLDPGDVLELLFYERE